MLVRLVLLFDTFDLFIVPGLYQGDIQLTPEQWEHVMNGSNSFGSIVGRRWTGGKIPYYIESSIGKIGL